MASTSTRASLTVPLWASDRGGGSVRNTKWGKGTKLMAVADYSGLPVSVRTASASPHEVSLVRETLAGGFVSEKPKRLIGDGYTIQTR